MSNTLGLDDDLDPVEAVIGLEKAFALKISDGEAAACNTVGDIYDLLLARFAGRIGEPGACMTSMAFYRLRRSLRVVCPGTDWRPDTALTPLAGGNVRAFFVELRRVSGLQMPEPRGTWLGGIGGGLALLAIVGAAIAAIKGALIVGLASAAMLVVGVVLIRLDPGGLPEGCVTLGDLATKVGALNYGALAGVGGAVRPKDLWDAMAEVLSAQSDFPASAMRRDMLILQSGAARV
ncbi:acyl carrier protein [Caulobacter sp. BP25]|uniref:acyl carrier protein n=1 Tax=Caulobacter sp. BP25 TaxID=2048900 RepID=UPI001181022B|nr:acyl carrier protein [Caulobacter sp. BP25]